MVDISYVALYNALRRLCAHACEPYQRALFSVCHSVRQKCFIY